MWGNYVDSLFYRTSCQYRMSQVGSSDVNNEYAVIVFSAFVGFHMTSFQSCDFADPQVRTAMSSRFPTKLNFRDDSWHSNCLSKQHVFLISGNWEGAGVTNHCVSHAKYGTCFPKWCKFQTYETLYDIYLARLLQWLRLLEICFNVKSTGNVICSFEAHNFWPRFPEDEVFHLTIGCPLVIKHDNRKSLYMYVLLGNSFVNGRVPLPRLIIRG